jgi:alpha-galactosidase/6-phospho-beta-glucosidase family protein
MSNLKIVLVGGGSVLWTPVIARDLMLTESLSDAEFVLYDINKEASNRTAAFCAKLAARLGVRARFVSTDQRERAFEGAHYIVITITTGGLDAMVHDLAIPEQYGIYHTVGDTSGPGGWARLIRNFDAFVSLAQDINRYARGAVVLNYTNPLSMLTDVLARLHEGPVVGLCHGLFENLEFIKELYGLESEDDIAVHYGGLNHFFWTTRARSHATDVIADLASRLKTQSFTDLKRPFMDDEGAGGDREVATELFRLTGVLPYLGDRHTCEFFSWYITNRDTMSRYKLVRTTIAERKASAAQSATDLRAMIEGEIPADYLTRSRETAADIIDAHSQGRVFIDVGNLPNVGQIASLAHGVVVETAVRVDGNGFTPLTFGPLPRVVQGLVEIWATVYTMTVDACFARDKALALRALRLDPVCAHLDGMQVMEMGERLLAAHKTYVTAF